jgi:phasin
MNRPSSRDHFFCFFRKTYCIAVSNDDVKVWPVALPLPKSQRCRRINDIGPALRASRPSSPQETPSGRVPYGCENHHSYETCRLHKNRRATTEATDLFKTSCASGLKGARDYNNKFMQFAHANTNAAFDFAQKLLGVRSPSEFMELSTEHMQTQTQALTEQTKELAELAQKVALGGAKSLQVGAAKAFNRVD